MFRTIKVTAGMTSDFIIIGTNASGGQNNGEQYVVFEENEVNENEN